jgi:hypothetical protein
MKAWLLPTFSLLGLAAAALIMRHFVGLHRATPADIAQVLRSLDSQSATITPVEGGGNCDVRVRSSGKRVVMPCDAAARYLVEDSKLQRGSNVEVIQLDASSSEWSGPITKQLLLAGFQVSIIQRGGIVRVGLITNPDPVSRSGGSSGR